MNILSLKGLNIQAVKHNEVVKQNRLVVERLVNTVCFLGKQEFGFEVISKGKNQSTGVIN